VLTELLDDVALARAPLDPAAALRLIGRTGLPAAAAKLCREADAEQLAQVVAQFSRLVAAAPWRRFVLELNPLRWRGSGAVAIDGLLIIEEP
jgi:hypothetical protein